jgi:hypothetical protein
MDANGNEITLGRKYINFTTQGPDITHFGVSGFMTLPFFGAGADLVTYSVYLKLTFQLADPR